MNQIIITTTQHIHDYWFNPHVCSHVHIIFMLHMTQQRNGVCVHWTEISKSPSYPGQCYVWLEKNMPWSVMKCYEAGFLLPIRDIQSSCKVFTTTAKVNTPKSSALIWLPEKHRGIDSTSLWNSMRGIQCNLPWEIPWFGILVVEKRCLRHHSRIS